MKTSPVLTRGCFLYVTVLAVAAAELKPALEVRRSGDSIQFSWPGTVPGDAGQIVRPFFELQRSADLQAWKPIGERLRAADATQDQPLGLLISADNPHAFYRLQATLPRTNLTMAATGAEAFGYGERFALSLSQIGQISPAEFAELYPNDAEYLPGIGWDPTTAAYWDRVNANPDLVNKGKLPTSAGYRTFDFRLNASELSVFKKNGFVVSERLGSSSFADVYYNIWHNDLPVFVSTDSILQAWHRTYDSMLEELEETYLFNGFERLLAEMASRLPNAAAQAGAGVLKDSVLDADYFLAVARSLLAGGNVPSALGLASQDARVAQTLADIGTQQLKQIPDFFGECRVVDFSQFTVRGHYTHTWRLMRYFQCVMWLGRTDFMVAGGPVERCPNNPVFASPRETGSAIVLWQLLNESGQLNAWLDMDRVIQTFVGWTDSLTFPQLGSILSAAGIRSILDVPDLAALQKLQTDILRGDLGVQNIRSDYFVSPFGSEQIQLPRSFLVFGQKFVPDSWAFSQTVYDNILWIENGMTNKVQRRVPSALDIAFAVLGNDQVVSALVGRMNNSVAAQSQNHAEKWRDGLPYQHHLAAVRMVMDQQSNEAWDSNIYMGWLAALRELSAPTTGTNYPDAMRTRPWAMKTLNTQLASWTQLRHDTILYAKQSYTATDACYYPEGFVEPQVAFWQRLRATALRAADLISGLQINGTYSFTTNRYQYDPKTGIGTVEVVTNTFTLAAIQGQQVAHLRRFADTLDTLARLSEKELAQECFNADDELFIRNLIQHVGTLPWGSGGVRKYDGWYPRLFYRATHFTSLNPQPDTDFQENYGVNAADQIVADVHTDIPDPVIGDPGSVLHEGIGPVNLLLIAVDNGSDRFVCAGPVLSHYEFEVIGEPRRVTDTEWKGSRSFFGPSGGFLEGVFPPDIPRDHVQGLVPPSWTRGYLVPKTASP